jgi:protein SMG6
MVPLPVITELDGLSKQPAPLGTQAQDALDFIASRIRSHGRSLKVQTSRGNYLADLAIRSEAVSFAFSSALNPEQVRDMDDLILRACAFQAAHFVDRTAVLGVSRDVPAGVKEQSAKVVLLTNDRNLRLRAKAQGVLAVDEKPMRKMLGLAKDGSPLPAAGG